MKRKVIFFDMGNTLLHFHNGDPDEVKDNFGIVLLTDYLKQFCPTISVDEVKGGFYNVWMNKIDLRKVTLTEYPIESLLNEFLSTYQVQLTLKECIEAIDHFYTGYREQLYTEEFLRETLEELRNRGYRLGVISNTCYFDEVMKHCFRVANIFDLFETYTFSYEIGICKPRMEIFQAALSKMHVNPSDCIMVGDNNRVDLKPAIELGMKAILLDRTNSQSDKEVMKINSIREILKYL
ncbi:Phosphatase [compost metagenome]